MRLNNQNQKEMNQNTETNIKEYLNGTNDHKNKNVSNVNEKKSRMETRDYWTLFSRIVTCCICPVCLTKCGKTSEPVQQAWREKMTMVLIYFFMMGLTGYFTFGLQKTICDTKISGYHQWRTIYKNNTFSINQPSGPVVRGYIYYYNQLDKLGIDIPEQYNATNLNSIFLTKKNKKFKSSCRNFIDNSNNCHIMDSNYYDIPCQDISILNRVPMVGKQVYTWKDIEAFKKPSIKDLKERPNSQYDYDVFNNSKLLAFNGAVLNITNLINNASTSNNTKNI